MIGNPLDNIIDVRYTIDINNVVNKEGVKTMPETIFLDHQPGTYKAYKTVGGWGILFLDEKNNSRPADGGKIYKHRQSAYRRCKQLNDSLPQTLETILRKTDVAWYEWDSYSVYVRDNTIEGEGYNLSVCKEAMPPHVSEDWSTLEEVEASLDGTLGYTKNSRVWQALENEDE